MKPDVLVLGAGVEESEPPQRARHSGMCHLETL